MPQQPVFAPETHAPARHALARLARSREALRAASTPPAAAGGEPLAALTALAALAAGLAAPGVALVRRRPLASLGLAALAGASVVLVPLRQRRWLRLAGMVAARHGGRWAMAWVARLPWSLLLDAWPRGRSGPGA